MTEHKVDDLLRDLAREINIDPSSSFAAGVRARIAETPSRRPMWWLSGAALVAASAVLVMVLVRPGAEDSGETGIDIVAQQPTTIADGSTLAPSHRGTPAPSDAPLHRSTVAPSHPEPHPRTLAPPHPRTFEVLVPPDQRILLERLMTALREGRIHVEPGGPAIDEVTGELLVPPAIEISPIVVRALPGTPERIDEGSTYK